MELTQLFFIFHLMFGLTLLCHCYLLAALPPSPSPSPSLRCHTGTGKTVS